MAGASGNNPARSPGSSSKRPCSAQCAIRSHLLCPGRAGYLFGIRWPRHAPAHCAAAFDGDQWRLRFAHAPRRRDACCKQRFRCIRQSRSEGEIRIAGAEGYRTFRQRRFPACRHRLVRFLAKTVVGCTERRSPSPLGEGGSSLKFNHTFEAPGCHRSCAKGEADYNNRIVFSIYTKKGQAYEVKRNTTRNNWNRSCRADRCWVSRRADCAAREPPSVGPGLQERPGTEGYSLG